MDYGLSQSGAERDQIMDALRTFGYRDARIVMKWDFDDGTVNYTEEGWGELIQSELRAGRPLIYCAFDMSSDSTAIGGHAFNVDGYDADNDMYHVNFGMSADKNTYYALNNFTLDNGTTVYDFYPILFADVQDPSLTNDPHIYTSTQSLNLECYAGETTTATFNVSSANLTGDITVTVTDANNVFSVDVTTIPLAEVNNKTVTVTYAPQEIGTHTATITLSSDGAQDVTVSLNGTATAAPLVKYNPVMQPADSAYINLTSFRANWTDQTPAENVTSYTLEVKEKPGAGGLIAEADWSNVPSSGSFTPYLPEGWEEGPYTIYLEGGCISITSDSYLKTNVLDLSGFDKVTVVFMAKNYYNWTNSALTVSTSIDSKYFEFTSQFAEYTVVLNCTDSEQIQFFANSYYPMIQWIKIYAGEVEAPQLRATETGDATYRLITGITDKFYTVENLTAEGTFLYKVKALYADNTESAWSNVEEVTLFANTPAGLRGDVNDDKKVDITDATMLINYLLSNDPTGINMENANCDLSEDGKVDITDATTLINYLLNNAW
ncbi:MAG: C10 family peptidase [Muribaculaceae bacterium]|nr:C10 family peptidase [Muribaculaceae bacterium]